MAEASRILIVGGGIAGLSAAIALADAGYPAELVESRADWPVTRAAITMHANEVRALGSANVVIRCCASGVGRCAPIRKVSGLALLRHFSSSRYDSRHNARRY